MLNFPRLIFKYFLFVVICWVVGMVGQVWDLQHYPIENTAVVFNDGTKLIGSLKKNMYFEDVITTPDAVEHTLGRNHSVVEYSLVKSMDRYSMLQHWRHWFPIFLVWLGFFLLNLKFLKRSGT